MYRVGALMLLCACAPLKVQHGPTSTLSLEQRRVALYVPVELAGETHWFFLDSGYSHTTCDDELATALALESRGRVWVRGMLGRVEATRSPLPPLSLGTHTVEGLSCTVRDLQTTSSVQPPPGAPLAGVLGVDVLDHFTWTLDPTARTLTLAPQSEPCAEGLSARLRGNPRRRKLRVRLDDGPARNLLVDTGSNRTLTHPAMTAHLAGRTEEAAVRATGSSEAVLREVERFEVEALTVDEVPLGRALVTTLPDGVHMAGLLGLDVLRQAPSCFDSQRHRFTVYPEDLSPR